MSSISKSNGQCKESECSAVVFDGESQSWLQFSRPCKLLTANSIDEVLPLLGAVEAAAATGLTAVGYVAYEAASAFDSSLSTFESNIPLAQFSLFDRSDQANLEPDPTALNLPLDFTINRSDYLQQLHRIRQLLGDGDIYQVNYTHQLRGGAPATEDSTLTLFKRLLQRQPSPRSVYYSSPDLTVMSVSPELFFSLQGDQISMEPMKGTRPRGKNTQEDHELKTELLQSEKERAENLMIVDMVRNDLARIARPGSVQVDELFHLTPLPSLWQQVSKVSAKTEASLAEIFSALFPCASITGAPKKHSMEVIRQLESGPRGVYTGAIGIVRPQRKMQFSVAIRSLVKHGSNGEYSYGVGSGVVWDSEPEQEWQETLDKTRIVRDHGGQDFKLLETLAWYPGEGTYLLKQHLDRLANSARYFGYALDLPAVLNCLENFSMEEPQKLRLLVQTDGSFQLQHEALHLDSGPVQLALAEDPVSSKDPFLQHKTTRREVYEQALAKADRANDVILWNERGELTETCIYNLYLQLGDRLLTPAVSSGLLAGTYRRMMLDTGQAQEATLTLEHLQEASGLFVSNSVRGFLPARLLMPARQSKAD